MIASDVADGRFGIGVQLNSTGAGELRRQGAAAEEAGFTFVSVGDNPEHMRDTFVSLAELAHATAHCSIGTTITTPHHRDPLVVASAFSSVAELAPGRVFVGIGTGRARRPARISELREHVQALRALWSREEVLHRGEPLRLSWDAAPVPIVVCGSGPRALETAGEYADGVIIETGLSEELVARAREWVAAGARRSGRRLEDLQLWWYARTSIGTTAAEAHAESDVSMAAAGANLARHDPGLTDVPERYRAGLRELGERYDMSAHLRTDADNPNRGLVGDELREYLADRIGVVGAPSDWLDRIAQLRDRGVDNILCIGASGDKNKLIRLVGEHVIPHLGGPRGPIGFAADHAAR
ncbi:LLM class flavin-dependent oxidoreductase [Dactylosporangium sp. NPDC000555]|uniref:LLM class flavin-dependent oxidoreductase n=1 Tax=Dactylosporangium sp. NPDC000555 TaxID=3154260 RepID=UPI00332AFAC7